MSVVPQPILRSQLRTGGFPDSPAQDGPIADRRVQRKISRIAAIHALWAADQNGLCSFGKTILLCNAYVIHWLCRMESLSLPQVTFSI